MSKKDIGLLIQHEKDTGESVASWQVRSLWDLNKNLVKKNSDAKELSDFMRALQDYYLRCLHAFYKVGYIRMLSTLLHPEYARFNVEFSGLDTSKLTFKSFSKTSNASKGRMSLASRSIRIAFEELELYMKKEIADRKIRKSFYKDHSSVIEALLGKARLLPQGTAEEKWRNAIQSAESKMQKQIPVQELLQKDTARHSDCRDFVESVFKTEIIKVGACVILG